MPPWWLDSLVCLHGYCPKHRLGLCSLRSHTPYSTQVQETPMCFWHMRSLHAWMPVWNPARKQQSSGRRSFLIPAPTHISLLNGGRCRHLEVSGARVSDALSCHFWVLAGEMLSLGEDSRMDSKSGKQNGGTHGLIQWMMIARSLARGRSCPPSHKPLTGPWRRLQPNKPTFSPRTGWRSNHHVLSLRGCTVVFLPLFLYLFLSRALSILWKQTNKQL